jgi:GntR family transcriptional repressor for pyruvate dehydrogenase complex
MTEPEKGRRKNLSQEITERLAEEILSGALPPGSRLMPERELAVKFRTNRNTLREAIRNLENLHLVSARQGDGMKVLDWMEQGEVTLLPWFLQHTRDLRATREVVNDFLRLRRLLVVDACGRLAQTASKSELEALLALVQKQRDQAGIPDQLVRTDLDIMLGLLRASHSVAYQWLFNTVVRLYVETVFSFPDLWVFVPDYVESLESVVAAALQGDSPAAAARMDRHLERSDQLIMDAVRNFQTLLE